MHLLFVKNKEKKRKQQEPTNQTKSNQQTNKNPKPLKTHAKQQMKQKPKTA